MESGLSEVPEIIPTTQIYLRSILPTATSTQLSQATLMLSGRTCPLTRLVSFLKISACGFWKAYWRGANKSDRQIDPPPLSLNTQPMVDSAEDEFWNTFTDFSSEGSSQGSPSSLSSTLSLVSLVPDFANPLPSSMDSVTIDSLHVNGVLSLPSACLQSALLQAFVECVQPTMPILEWQEFLNAIYGRGNGHGSVSLLLFHAVMFSATTFVDLGHLHAAGYTSRREAHEAFFQKAKVSLAVLIMIIIFS